MSKNVARGRSECVQRTGIVSKVFLMFFCPAIAQLPVTPLLVSSSVSNSIAG